MCFFEEHHSLMECKYNSIFFIKKKKESFFEIIFILFKKDKKITLYQN